MSYSQTRKRIKVPFNDLYIHYLSIKDEVDQAIASVISSSAFVRGPFVKKFEKDFAQLFGSKNCISCANGTDALYIAMKSLGLQAGDEVITTAHSWISTSETITQAGGRVVFADTENEFFTIDANQIEPKITDKTKGIIPVHLYGQAADMGAIISIARKYGLWVIEDCAQAHLATYKGKLVGTFGDAATFSFYPGKNLGAMGDAGAIITNDDKIASWMRLYANHGGKGNHEFEGINSRLDGLQAAILSTKLSHLSAWTIKRQEVAAKYNQLLQNIDDISLPVVRYDTSHVYHLYVILTEHRDNLRDYLKDRGIETAINYPYALPYCQAYNYLQHLPQHFPNAHANQSRILSLPIFPEITEEQILYVANSIKAYFYECKL